MTKGSLRASSVWRWTEGLHLPARVTEESELADDGGHIRWSYSNGIGFTGYSGNDTSIFSSVCGGAPKSPFWSRWVLTRA